MKVLITMEDGIIQKIESTSTNLEVIIINKDCNASFKQDVEKLSSSRIAKVIEEEVLILPEACEEIRYNVIDVLALAIKREFYNSCPIIKEFTKAQKKFIFEEADENFIESGLHSIHTKDSSFLFAQNMKSFEELFK